MGYDMFVKYPVGREDIDYFHTTIWGMGRLREAMALAGVDFVTVTDHFAGIEEDGKYPIKHTGPLSVAFSSNDGWLVTPKECNHIADKLEEFDFTGRSIQTPDYDRMFREKTPVTEILYKEEVLSPDTVQFIQSFAKFCRSAAKRGGFHVW